MANGGWYGTEEEWQRVEAPLLEIDDIFQAFADSLGYPVERNYKDNPSRSIVWDNGVRCLIQLFQVNETALTFNLWICASLDKGGRRYQRDETLVNGMQVHEFAPTLPQLLDKAATKLHEWSSKPENLEFKTTLG